MGAGNSTKKKEHLLGPDPFQQNFVPQYNPYGSNYYAFSPRRRRRHHGRHRRHHGFPYGPNPYSGSFFGPQVLVEPVIPFGQTGSVYGDPFAPPLVVNPPCGGAQCTSYEQSNGEYEAPIGTQCTCCALGKRCRMNPPNGMKYNDCCHGMDCNNGVCMKK